MWKRSSRYSILSISGSTEGWGPLKVTASAKKSFYSLRRIWGSYSCRNKGADILAREGSLICPKGKLRCFFINSKQKEDSWWPDLSLVQKLGRRAGAEGASGGVCGQEDPMGREQTRQGWKRTIPLAVHRYFKRPKSILEGPYWSKRKGTVVFGCQFWKAPE